MEQDLTQLAVIILCAEMGDCFATEADTKIDIVCEADLNKD